MGNPFYDAPILNSPYESPSRHWELDDQGQPTQQIIEKRRDVRYVSPIPRPRKKTGDVAARQARLTLEAEASSKSSSAGDPTPYIREIRSQVEEWRKLPDATQWGVTPVTRRLLQHWRQHKFTNLQPFFCQIEAAETAVWLTEVALKRDAAKRILQHLADSSAEANPGLDRIALKLATGAGKTTVMAMLIAWQTLNAVHDPKSRLFTTGFLVVAPGITIRDRLRVLLPNDSESYYLNRELIPAEFAEAINKAKIVITNYHAFKLHERVKIQKAGRLLLEGPTGERIKTLETRGQMIHRVMPELESMKRILVLNDEAHHCYRERVKGEDDEEPDKADDREEVKANREAARLWISGLEAVEGKMGISRVLDLSATPFFLRGSGYETGTLFPWTITDFSLMDAIECGIVKLPRVPVADNIPGAKVPIFRNIWEHIRTRMPKKGRGKAHELDPLKLPLELQTALEALYGHYEKVFKLWKASGVKVPPCFIVVCNNTSTSKLVYDYISGFHPVAEDGTPGFHQGALDLFRNFDNEGNKFPKPRTLLIDSMQLESGESLDDEYHKAAADQIERFRREIQERTGDAAKAENLSEQDILREVMNTVGKPGTLGADIRCVVSVSMLTEGWDANNVTHILGVRAFGTQLLCEQVIGRALRRQSYELNSDNRLDVEYADILGIPFDFAAEPVMVAPQSPREVTQVRAERPARDALEIRFPRVSGYRVELPDEELSAAFTPDSRLELTPELVRAPTITQNSGIVGKSADLTLKHLEDMRSSTIVFELTKHLVLTKWRDQGEGPNLNLFGQLKRIAKEWMDDYLDCRGDTYPAQLMHAQLKDMACEKITAAITRKMADTHPVKAVLDPFNPTGSTRHVRFSTTRTDLYQTDARKCHVNWIVLDSGWESEFCRVVESHPQVKAYVKNHNLGFEVPYLLGGEPRRYLPDFIVLVDDGHGSDDLLHLIVEIKGYRREDARAKKETMEEYWIKGINHNGGYGRWAFAEFGDVWELESDLSAKIESRFHSLVNTTTQRASA